MAAYFVYVCQEVTDRESLETYWTKIGSTIEGYEARNIAAYTCFEQLEGEKIEGVAVIEFPTFERAKEWYDSPAYRAIRHYRQDGAKYIGVIAEGGAAPPAERMPQTKQNRRKSVGASKDDVAPTPLVIPGVAQRRPETEA